MNALKRLRVVDFFKENHVCTAFGRGEVTGGNTNPTHINTMFPLLLTWSKRRGRLYSIGLWRYFFFTSPSVSSIFFRESFVRQLNIQNDCYRFFTYKSLKGFVEFIPNVGPFGPEGEQNTNYSIKNQGCNFSFPFAHIWFESKLFEGLNIINSVFFIIF